MRTSNKMRIAMSQALQLRDYEDMLNPADVYSLLALTSGGNKAFETCSKVSYRRDSQKAVLRFL